MQLSSIFKKVAIVAIALNISVAANSQQTGDMLVGGNLVIGTGNNYTNVGIGAKFFYNVTDPIRLGGEFDFFMKKDYVSWWDFSVYGHYLFPVADGVNLFPAVGLGMIGSIIDMPIFGKHSNSWFVFTVGGGADFALNDNLVLTGELRLKVFENTNRINLAVGMAYRF